MNLKLCCLLFCGIIFQVAANPNCDFGTNFYQELGCKPIRNKKSSCPKAYDCPKYELTPKMCRHLGVYYKDGEVNHNTKWCNVGCYCSVDSDSSVGRFECAGVDCYFGDYSPECYKTYTLGQCCANIEPKCEPYGDIARCESDNSTYLEGQIFAPKGTCWSCVCQKGYDGIPKEPFCTRLQCDMELRYSKELVEKCAPVYHNRDHQCCPGSFLCPKKVGKIRIVGGNRRDGECTLGEHKIPVGGKFDAVESFDSNPITCACNVPPLPSCYYS